MHLLNPFMPFISEEFYHTIGTKTDDLIIKQFVLPSQSDEKVLEEAELARAIISAIRDVRNKNQLKPKELLKVSIVTHTPQAFSNVLPAIIKGANLESLAFADAGNKEAIAFVVGQHSFYVHAGHLINQTDQLAELEKELDYLKGFLNAVQQKLANEKFVANAKPEMVEKEHKKMEDAMAKIKSIQDRLGLN
jgi:valyl-tRNA synthetase